MNTKNKEGALSFATHTTCYLNDFTCNAIKDAESILKSEDKETLKIFGAAKKRAKAYLSGFDKCIWDNIDYWANYCMFLDDYTSIAYNNLFDAVADFFAENSEGNTNAYAISEVLKMTILHNNLAIRDIVDVLKKNSIEHDGLIHDLMYDIERIILNLEKWVLRKVPKETISSLYKDSRVEECRRELCVVLISSKRHAEAKLFAEKEGLNNGK